MNVSLCGHVCLLYMNYLVFLILLYPCQAVQKTERQRATEMLSVSLFSSSFHSNSQLFDLSVGTEKIIQTLNTDFLFFVIQELEHIQPFHLKCLFLFKFFFYTEQKKTVKVKTDSPLNRTHQMCAAS